MTPQDLTPSNKTTTPTEDMTQSAAIDCSGSSKVTLSIAEIDLIYPRLKETDVEAIHGHFNEYMPSFSTGRTGPTDQCISNFVVECQEARGHIVMGFYPTCAAGPDFRVSWRPSASQGSNVLADIEDLFFDLVCDGVLEYGLGADERVEQIRIAADIPGLEVSRLLVFTDHATRSVAHRRGDILEGYSFRAANSPHHTRVYDLSAELKRLGCSEEPLSPVTRVERTITNAGPIHKLAEMPNPFTGLHLVDCDDQPDVPDDLWDLFLCCARQRSAQAALGALPGRLSAEMRAALRPWQAHGWDPDEIWRQWPDALKSLGLPA